jgi:endonuclease/exonuclease/phosphatase family metal-dependent hydrolase
MYFSTSLNNDVDEQYDNLPDMDDRSIPVKLGSLTVDKLILNPEFYQKNRHGEIVRFYKEQINKTEAQALQTAEIEEHNDNLATLNLHYFHPINLEHKKKEVMEAPIKFMKRFNISVLALQEVPVKSLPQFTAFVERSGLYHTANEFDHSFGVSKEPITNMVISRYPIVVERRLILPAEQPYIFRHRHAIFFRIPAHPIWPTKLFAATHLEVAEFRDHTESDKVRIRKNQIRAIMDMNPDFIMGDLNFVEHTPEYKMIDRHFMTSKARDANGETYTTTPWWTTVDYIWYKKSDPNAKWYIETYSANYPWSDHRPVIGVYKPQ